MYSVVANTQNSSTLPRSSKTMREYISHTKRHVYPYSLHIFRNKCSLRKQPAFRHFPEKGRLWNERRNSLLMMSPYPYQSRASEHFKPFVEKDFVASRNVGCFVRPPQCRITFFNTFLTETIRKPSFFFHKYFPGAHLWPFQSLSLCKFLDLQPIHYGLQNHDEQSKSNQIIVTTGGPHNLFV